MLKLNRIAVFCGASKGIKKEYAEAAKKLAIFFCENNIGLVYGGCRIGLMQVLADTMLDFKGDVIGVIPRFLMDRELAHEEIAELHLVDTLSERKAKIAEMADAFILLPGGAGSLDEFFEMLTWNKVGLQNKPCAILNTAHFFDPLIQFIDHATVRI